MDLGRIHGYVLGYATVAAWAVVAVWSLALRLLRRDDTPAFWKGVSAAQILLGIQLVVGLALLAFGRRPGPDGNDDGLTLLFHLSYALLSPLVVLVVGHRLAREGRRDPHTVFAVVGLVIFGLSYRALQVGAFGR